MEKSSSREWPQYLAAITATLSMAISGSHIGWTSPTLPNLKSDDSHLKITSDDASWIASFYLLGSIPGNIIAGLLVDWLGRKTSLIAAGIPLTLGWILILMAWNPYVLFASRFISGIGQGIVYVICPMYIGEIADKNIRGSLGSFIKLMVTFGELYGHAIGPFVSYGVLAYASIIIPIIFFVTFSFMPESPYYLLMKNQRPKAEKSLAWLRRYENDEDLKEETDQMQKTVIKDLMNKGHFWDLFDTPGNRKAVLVSFGLQFVLQFSGIAAIESYTQEIFDQSGSEFSAAQAVILLSLVQLLAGLAAAALVDKIGRIPLLITTTFLAGLSLALSSIFYFLKFQMTIDMSGLGTILVAFVIFYELIIALGLNPLPYMMLGELFPTSVKGFAVSIANVWGSFLAFFVSKLHQVVADNCGIYASFAWFATSCFLGLVFIIFCVPETKGKSLMEIQEELNCGKKKKKIEETMNVSTIA